MIQRHQKEFLRQFKLFAQVFELLKDRLRRSCGQSTFRTAARLGSIGATGAENRPMSIDSRIVRFFYLGQHYYWYDVKKFLHEYFEPMGGGSSPV
jgi:hypothetical protein